MAIGERHNAKREKYSDSNDGEQRSLLAGACAELFSGVGQGLSDEGSEVAAHHSEDAEHRERCCRSSIKCLRGCPPGLMAFGARWLTEMVAQPGSKENAPNRDCKSIGHDFIDRG